MERSYLLLTIYCHRSSHKTSGIVYPTVHSSGDTETNNLKIMNLKKGSMTAIIVRKQDVDHALASNG